MLVALLACSPAAIGIPSATLPQADVTTDTAEPHDTATAPDSEPLDTGHADSAPTPTDTADTSAPVDTGPWDADGDGYYASADCDDANPELHPGAADDTDDDVDQDCDGEADEDFDACAVASGTVSHNRF